MGGGWERGPGRATACLARGNGLRCRTSAMDGAQGGQGAPSDRSGTFLELFGFSWSRGGAGCCGGAGSMGPGGGKTIAGPAARPAKLRPPQERGKPQSRPPHHQRPRDPGLGVFSGNKGRGPGAVPNSIRKGGRPAGLKEGVAGAGAIASRRAGPPRKPPRIRVFVCSAPALRCFGPAGISAMSCPPDTGAGPPGGNG